MLDYMHTNGLTCHLPQKTNIIRDYLEDIEEEPAPRYMCPLALFVTH